jgi:hypothetical protein
VPDPHLYFQAPGGQVFKLVGINEDLSACEDSFFIEACFIEVWIIRIDIIKYT